MNGVGPRLRRLFWTRHARNWDALHSSPEVLAHYREVVAWIADAAFQRGRLLDIGCGTGRHATALALRGFEVVALDFAPAMLARATARAARQGAALDLRQADVRARLPFDDGSFEVVLCSYVLQTINDPVALLREARRVLRPHGVLLVEVPVRRATWAEIAKNPTSRLFLLVKLVGSRIPGAVQTYSAERLEDQLHGAGFSVDQRRLFRRSYGVIASRSPTSPVRAHLMASAISVLLKDPAD